MWSRGACGERKRALSAAERNTIRRQWRRVEAASRGLPASVPCWRGQRGQCRRAGGTRRPSLARRVKTNSHCRCARRLRRVQRFQCHVHRRSRGRLAAVSEPLAPSEHPKQRCSLHGPLDRWRQRIGPELLGRSRDRHGSCLRRNGSCRKQLDGVDSHLREPPNSARHANRAAQHHACVHAPA